MPLHRPSPLPRKKHTVTRSRSSILSASASPDRRKPSAHDRVAAVEAVLPVEQVRSTRLAERLHPVTLLYIWPSPLRAVIPSSPPDRTHGRDHRVIGLE